MKKNKKRFSITKQKTKYALVFILGGLFFLLIAWFFDNYRFQSPITERFVTPLGKNEVKILPIEDFTEAQDAVEGNKATPSPTPGKRR